MSDHERLTEPFFYRFATVIVLVSFGLGGMAGFQVGRAVFSPLEGHGHAVAAVGSGS